MKKRILIACEESQIICNEFRKQYPEWETFSCDIKPCSGGHPEWHYESLRIKDNELRSTIRSKTFPGIAQAIVNQWGEYLNKEV